MTGKVDLIGSGSTTTITLNGDTSTITAGSNGANGILSLHDAYSTLWWGVLINSHNRSLVINKVLTPNQQGAFPVISFSGVSGFGGIGGNGQDGHLGIFPASAQGSTIYESMSGASIHLDGKNGDIVLQNADCAEEFDIAEGADPGTVMTLDAEGKLRQSCFGYDKGVAGVISGAGEYRPAILLDKRRSGEQRVPIALVGKAFCKVDATFSPIVPGDLLTTSPTPGHATKATDPLRAFGAVLGKALQPLSSGRGLLPILVTLH